jgi:hypothetical protein
VWWLGTSPFLSLANPFFTDLECISYDSYKQSDFLTSFPLLWYSSRVWTQGLVLTRAITWAMPPAPVLVVLRQSLAMEVRLAFNFWLSCLSLLSAGIIGMCHHKALIVWLSD